MRLTFICVGRLSREYAAVWKHYENLLKPYATLKVLEVAEVALASGEDYVKAKESAAILALLRPDAFTIALDIQGTDYSSEGLSRMLADKKLHGQSHFQFILGGAVGLEERVLAASHKRWSLSPLTFPHQMARCMVVEQVYRSIRIERGEPYHH